MPLGSRSGAVSLDVAAVLALREAQAASRELGASTCTSRLRPGGLRPHCRGPASRFCPSTSQASSGGEAARALLTAASCCPPRATKGLERLVHGPVSPGAGPGRPGPFLTPHFQSDILVASHEPGSWARATPHEPTSAAATRLMRAQALPPTPRSPQPGSAEQVTRLQGEWHTGAWPPPGDSLCHLGMPPGPAHGKLQSAGSCAQPVSLDQQVAGDKGFFPGTSSPRH